MSLLLSSLTASLCICVCIPSIVEVILYPGYKVPVLDTKAIKTAFQPPYKIPGNYAPRPSVTPDQYNKYRYSLVNNPGNPNTPLYKWVKVKTARPPQASQPSQPSQPPQPTQPSPSSPPSQPSSPSPPSQPTQPSQPPVLITNTSQSSSTSPVQQLVKKLIINQMMKDLLTKQNKIKQKQQFSGNVLTPQIEPPLKIQPFGDDDSNQEDGKDIETVIENMPVSIQTMNTLKEILNLQTKEQSPKFNPETFKDFFPPDLGDDHDELQSIKPTSDIFDIPIILQTEPAIPDLTQQTIMKESGDDTGIDIVLLKNVIEDIEPSDEATANNKREILNSLAKYERLGPDWLEQEGYQDPSGNNYKYVYVKNNRRLDTFSTIPLNHFKKIIRSIQERHANLADKNIGDEYDYKLFAEGEIMKASPSNINNAYNHWVDTQTMDENYEYVSDEIREESESNDEYDYPSPWKALAERIHMKSSNKNLDDGMMKDQNKEAYNTNDTESWDVPIPHEVITDELYSLQNNKTNKDNYTDKNTELSGSVKNNKKDDALKRMIFNIFNLEGIEESKGTNVVPHRENEENKEFWSNLQITNTDDLETEHRKNHTLADSKETTSFLNMNNKDTTANIIKTATEQGKNIARIQGTRETEKIKTEVDTNKLRNASKIHDTENMVFNESNQGHEDEATEDATKENNHNIVRLSDILSLIQLAKENPIADK